MISGLVVIGGFMLAVIGLAVMGRHVENPADRAVSLEDRLAMLKNDMLTAFRAIGAPLLPVIQSLQSTMESIAALGRTMGATMESIAALGRTMGAQLSEAMRHVGGER